MIRPEVIRKRLDKLDEYLSILEKARGYAPDEFSRTPEYYGSAERFLHLSIEALNDMAGHVVAARDLGPVNRYRDLPMIFARQGWIDDALEEKWIRMTSFRNILIHDYLDVDRSIVYGILQNDLDDLRRLRDVFVQFL